jgi:hypothetical protein
LGRFCERDSSGTSHERREAVEWLMERIARRERSAAGTSEAARPKNDYEVSVFKKLFCMKSKIKKPAEAEKLTVSGYTVKLKTDLAALAVVEAKALPVSFVLHLDFGFSDEASILFLVGLNTDWKKHIQLTAWLKTPLVKQTWLGTCELKGEDMHLLVKKGKIPRTAFDKAIKQNPALKKFNWIITEEISDDEDDDLLNEEPEIEAVPATSTETSSKDRERANAINANLVKLIPNLKGATPENRRVLLAQIEKLADALYAIPNWEDYTDDSIERYLEQIERFLAKEEQEKAEPSDKERAEKLAQQLAAYLAAFKKATESSDKQKIMSAMQSAAQKLEAVPNWRDYTDDKLEAILAQLPKPKNTANSEADDKFIVEHKAKINEFTTVEAVAEHSKIVNQLAQTQAQKAFAQTVAEYAEHLQQANVHINDILDEQEKVNRILAAPETTEEQRKENQTYLSQLEEALKVFLN